MMAIWAKKICDGGIPASREKRLSRRLNNAADHFEAYVVPVAGALLMSLAQQPLTLVVDGTAVGRGCVALYVGVVYRKKLLPIGLDGRSSEKGTLARVGPCRPDDEEYRSAFRSHQSFKSVFLRIPT
jgi:hypothetical protein